MNPLIYFTSSAFIVTNLHSEVASKVPTPYAGEVSQRSCKLKVSQGTSILKKLIQQTNMISRNTLSSVLLLAVCVVAATLTSSADAFTAQSIQSRALTSAATGSPTALSVFGKKKEEEDLSFLEVRDLTREEMLQINKRNEEVMNQELQAMTGISVLFSIPILYLCWVAFFSD